MNTPKSFYELELADLTQWLRDRKQPAYRAKQIYAWAYERQAASFEQMTDVPAALREELTAAFCIGPFPILARSANDESAKFLVELRDGQTVECVRIEMGDAETACVSSQVGCCVDCAFCATGQTKLQRSLSAAEIIRQVITINSEGGPVRNTVFMGMGEPFLNYANVVTAVRRLVNKSAFAMSPRRLTISTAGVVPGIHRYAEEGLPTELAVSLNASTDEQRRELMPGVSRWPLAELMRACRHFSDANKGRPVTFAYVLLAGVNDNFDDAHRLGKLLRDQPHHLNIIPWNVVSGTRFQSPDKARVRAFLEACRRQYLNASIRHSKGGDIDAACGQLRVRHH